MPGNFCGVCPGWILGGCLKIPLGQGCVYRHGQRERPAFCRLSLLVWSDTHGAVVVKTALQKFQIHPVHVQQYENKEENPNGKPEHPHPAEGL